MTSSPGRSRRWVIALAAATALVGVSSCSSVGAARRETGSGATGSPPTTAASSATPSATPTARPDASPTTATLLPHRRTALLVAAGDIACNPLDRQFGVGLGEETGCKQQATSDLVLGLHPAAVLPLGDTQYQHGTYQGFLTSYAPTWGRFRSISHPVIGNHEYDTPHAAGYFAYFGRAAGDPRKAYYSFDIARWHVVVLNNAGCAHIGGCGRGSPQERWLRRDLAAHRTHCTLAAWHEPRFSSGQHGSDPAFQALWADLYAGGVDVVLAGHDHDYERFAPLDASGRPDPHGIRSFVVGTGGVGLRRLPPAVITGTVVRQDSTFGVLALELRPTGYDWTFVPVGTAFSDTGHGTCR